MSTAAQAVHIARAADVTFENTGRRAQFMYRDPDIRDATDGRFDVKVLRTSTGPGARSVSHYVHDLDYQMVYVLKG